MYHEFYKFLQFLECEWKNFKWSNFLSLNVNVNSVVRSHRDGQISPFITQGTLYFPHSWLSSHGKNKFPHSLLRSSWGNLLSPFLLSHSWGKYNVPFVIHGKISFSPFVAPPLKGKNPIPIPPNYGIKPFLWFWVSGKDPVIERWLGLFLLMILLTLFQNDSKKVHLNYYTEANNSGILLMGHSTWLRPE